MATIEPVNAPHQIFIVDRHPWVIRALEQFILHQKNYHLQQTFVNWQDLLRVDEKQRQTNSIVLLDWDSPDINREVLHRIRQALGQTKIVAMGTWLTSQQSALAEGADAYIHKTDPPEQILSVLDQMGRHPAVLAD